MAKVPLGARHCYRAASIEIVTLDKGLHVSKANSSMLVTDAGMSTLVIELHPLKAECAMLVTDIGTATFANELHPLKSAPLDAGLGRRNGHTC